MFIQRRSIKWIDEIILKGDEEAYRNESFKKNDLSFNFVLSSFSCPLSLPPPYPDKYNYHYVSAITSGLSTEFVFTRSFVAKPTKSRQLSSQILRTLDLHKILKFTFAREEIDFLDEDGHLLNLKVEKKQSAHVNLTSKENDGSRSTFLRTTRFLFELVPPRLV